MHVEEADPDSIKANMLQRIAVIMARCNANAIKRREVSRARVGRPDASRQLLVEAAAFEAEDV